MIAAKCIKEEECHFICTHSMWYMEWHYFAGSFVQHSSIMARQHEYAREMEEAMTMLDHQFFGDYFRRYNEHLSAIPIAGRPVPIPNDKLYSLLGEALLSSYPQSNYEYGPFRYKYYHFLMKISPTWARDCLVKRFVKMPEFWRKLHILHMLIMKACYFVLCCLMLVPQNYFQFCPWLHCEQSLKTCTSICFHSGLRFVISKVKTGINCIL